MSFGDREQLIIRVTPDQDRRIDKVRRYQGQTKQAFAVAALMRAVEAVEEEMRDADERKILKRGRREGPRGLDINNEDAKPGKRDDEAPAAPQGQVVVNVGNNSSSGSNGNNTQDAITLFAAHIADAPTYERERRTRHAVEVLCAGVPNPDERKVLAARLDAAVAEKLKTKPSDVERVKRVAAFAWDKVKGMLGDD